MEGEIRGRTVKGRQVMGALESYEEKECTSEYDSKVKKLKLKSYWENWM